MEIKQYHSGMENDIIGYGGHIGVINPFYRDPIKIRKAEEIQEKERKVEPIESINSTKFLMDVVRERMTGGNINIKI